MKLKVCFVSAFPPNHARLSEYAENLVTALATQPEIDQLIILADKSSLPKDSLPRNSKVKVLRVWQPDGFISIANIMFYLLKLKPDVIHFNVSFQSFGKKKISNVTGLSLILLSRLLGFRVLAGIHTLGEKTNLKEFNVNPSFLNKQGIQMATRLILSAQNVVVLVRSYGDFLSEHYKHKGVRYIPHGTYVDSNPDGKSDNKVILIFGHMGPHKGLPLMLQAFEEINKKIPDAKLVVAGSNHPNYPNYLDQFVKACLPNVDFVGYVPQDKLSSVFKKAHVVVLPYSAAPGTSGVFHLACGYGRPIVASNLQEINELVQDGASAILVPPGDLDALVDAILEVLSDKELEAKMCCENLKFAQKESWSSVGKAYKNAYLALLKN